MSATFRVRHLVLALGATGLAACANTGELRVGAGASGVVTDVSDGGWYTSDRRHESGLRVNNEHLELRGRALVLDATAGLEAAQALVGSEWGRVGGEDYRADLYGMRVRIGHGPARSRLYGLVVGRHVRDAADRGGFFDGADLGFALEETIRGALAFEGRLLWSYTDGDAVRAGLDDVSEVRLALGIRLAF